jgi:hypothetical protein
MDFGADPATGGVRAWLDIWCAGQIRDVPPPPNWWRDWRRNAAPSV